MGVAFVNLHSAPLDLNKSSCSFKSTFLEHQESRDYRGNYMNLTIKKEFPYLNKVQGCPGLQEHFLGDCSLMFKGDAKVNEANWGIKMALERICR